MKQAFKEECADLIILIVVSAAVLMMPELILLVLTGPLVLFLWPEGVRGIHQDLRSWLVGFIPYPAIFEENQ